MYFSHSQMRSPDPDSGAAASTQTSLKTTGHSTPQRATKQAQLSKNNPDLHAA